MIAETVLRAEAMDALIEKFGEVDAERFIFLVKRDHFDYTEWRQKLWEGKTLEELHQLATDYETANGAAT
jgi:hypothetical protein